MVKGRSYQEEVVGMPARPPASTPINKRLPASVFEDPSLWDLCVKPWYEDSVNGKDPLAEVIGDFGAIQGGGAVPSFGAQGNIKHFEDGGSKGLHGTVSFPLPGNPPGPASVFVEIRQEDTGLVVLLIGAPEGAVEFDAPSGYVTQNAQGTCSFISAGTYGIIPETQKEGRVTIQLLHT
jgi:hypothetical protein